MAAEGTEKFVPYECQRCSEKFFAYKDYKNHMRDHIITDQDSEHRSLVNNIHQCSVCEREFRFKCQLTRHWNAEHSRYSRKIYNQISRGERRVKKVGGEQQQRTHDRSAEEIGYRKTYDYSNDHPNSVSGTFPAAKGRFSCPACQREFLNHVGLQGHLDKYRNKKVYKCSYCEKQFHYRTSWKRHEECHKSERRVWECDTCTLTFTQKVNLKRHKEGNKNPCSLTKYVRSYRDRTALQCTTKPANSAQLLRYSHSDEEEEEEEEEEDDEDRADTKSATETTITSSHDSTHNLKGDVLYKCSVCDKLFTYRSLWSRHEKEHRTSKSFLCHVCGTKFTRQFYLSRHRKVCMARLNAQSIDTHKVVPARTGVRTELSN